MRCYGERALEVLDVAGETGLTGALAEGHPALGAEAVYAARAEMAVHLNDVLARRTRLALTDRSAGIGAGATAADLMSDAFGWSTAETARQIAAHRAEVETERALPLAADGAHAPAPAPARRTGTA